MLKIQSWRDGISANCKACKVVQVFFGSTQFRGFSWREDRRRDVRPIWIAASCLSLFPPSSARFSVYVIPENVQKKNRCLCPPKPAPFFYCKSYSELKGFSWWSPTEAACTRVLLAVRQNSIVHTMV